MTYTAKTTKALRLGRSAARKARVALATALVAAGLVAPALVAGVAASPAHASTIFIVNSTSDFPDVNVGDGVCDTFSGSGGSCTLRAAIQQANATLGADVVDFDIGPAFRDPASNVATISPNSPLPNIIDKVTIDGYTEPGAQENTLSQGTDAQIKVELSGANAGTANGLVVSNFSGARRASGSVVRGLVIDRFSRSGIVVRDLDDTKVEGNFVGTDPSGTLDRGNGGYGVEILDGATFSTVGGNAHDNPAARNLISANDADGVHIHGFASVGLQTTRNEVLGNLIGTKKDGTTSLGNAGSGVLVEGASSNDVGSGSSTSANTVAFNGKDGVRVVAANGDSATGNFVAINSVFSNAALGIDLIGEGTTANDPGDADQGPNGLQNKPVLSSAKNGGGKTTVKGALNALPNTNHLLYFYSNPSGGDEGKTFVGFESVSTDSSGNASFSFQPTSKVARGRTVTATATANVGSFSPNTSEFSAPRTVR